MKTLENCCDLTPGNPRPITRKPGQRLVAIDPGNQIALRKKSTKALVTHMLLFFASPRAPAGARLNIEVVPEGLMTTDALVLDAMKEDGRNLRFLAATLRNDRDVVLAAVEQDGYALQSAPESLRNDRSVVLAVLQQTGRTLQFASESLRDDRAIILTAVQQNGYESV